MAADTAIYGDIAGLESIVKDTVSKFKGFYFEKYVDMEIKEDKIYGVHNEKVNKVIKSFKSTNKNHGVILSGDKGIGKSLFAKLLANTAIQNNIPHIVVSRPGISVCCSFSEVGGNNIINNLVVVGRPQNIVVHV